MHRQQPHHWELWVGNTTATTVLVLVVMAIQLGIVSWDWKRHRR
jgi:hypothetical protein